MPNLLTIFIFPLTVAVLALVIEYWIIQPIKEANETIDKDNRLQNRNINWPAWIKRFILLTGVASFEVVNCF